MRICEQLIFVVRRSAEGTRHEGTSAAVRSGSLGAQERGIQIAVHSRSAVEASKMDKLILQRFKSKGLTLTSEAFKKLKSQLSKENDSDQSLENILDAIEERIAKQEIQSSVIDVNVMRDIVAASTLTEQDLVLERLELIDAFKGPRLSFDERQKTYTL